MKIADAVDLAGVLATLLLLILSLGWLACSASATLA